MALNDAALTVGGTAMMNAIGFLQLHNGAPGAGYTSNVVGSRVAATGSIDADGDFTRAGSWTGLTANQTVTHVSYWSASSGGTNYGGVTNGSGDSGANAAGAFNFTATENGTAT